MIIMVLAEEKTEAILFISENNVKIQTGNHEVLSKSVIRYLEVVKGTKSNVNTFGLRAREDTKH